MALLLLCFTQCKPSQEEGGDENTQKVRVSCVIPINDDGDKSDFTHLMTDGQINWSDGRECVYLAIPGNEPKGIKPQIIELEGWSDGYYSKIEFGGEIDKNLIISGQEYDLWYFGNSQQAVIHYVELTNEGTSVKGSIANQSGRLEDLGYYHIAKTKVTAVIENDGIKLNIKGFLKSQIAIALLDLENASVLCGSAIRGTEYILEYNVISEKYELKIEENIDAKINVQSAKGISYVVLFPNEEEETVIKSVLYDKIYYYTFLNGVKANDVYYRVNDDGNTVESLIWEMKNEIGGYEYVDLGLPSGLLWATCNVGANSPEEYGDYFAWGEITTKETYTQQNCKMYNIQLTIDNISGSRFYDAARANWGGEWKMPTQKDYYELKSYCKFEKTTQNGIYGTKVTSNSNGNYIFFPFSGYYYNSTLYRSGIECKYWTSEPYINYGLYQKAYYYNVSTMDYDYRYFGGSIRPVISVK